MWTVTFLKTYKKTVKRRRKQGGQFITYSKLSKFQKKSWYDTYSPRKLSPVKQLMEDKKTEIMEIFIYAGFFILALEWPASKKQQVSLLSICSKIFRKNKKTNVEEAFKSVVDPNLDDNDLAETGLGFGALVTSRFRDGPFPTAAEDVGRSCRQGSPGGLHIGCHHLFLPPPPNAGVHGNEQWGSNQAPPDTQYFGGAVEICQDFSGYVGIC